MFQTGGHQGAVAIVPGTAFGGGLGALRPAIRQGALGVTPAQQILEPLQGDRTAHIATQRAALLISPEDSGHAALPFASSPFERDDVGRLEKTMLAIEESRELIQGQTLVLEEIAQFLAALRL